MKKLRPALMIAALMFTCLPAHATSFDCKRGRSLTEQMICNDPTLSTLDDTLGQLYWKARRRVIDRRAFLSDSDSKWAWREANCRDAACLGTWYATRIEELQRLIAGMQAGTQSTSGVSGVSNPSVTSNASDASTASLMSPTSNAPIVASERRKQPIARPLQTDAAMLQCTAANPGIVVNEPCSTVIKENGSQWKYKPHGGDWFCGMAMLPPASTEVAANAAP